MTEPVDEHIEAERLRQLRAEIESLLREYDDCAVVFLAGREGRFEHFNRLDATWSKVRYVEAPEGDGIRLRSKGEEYGGDAARQKRELEWSVGVVSGFAQMMAGISIAWLKAARVLDAKVGATHTPWERDDPRNGPTA